MNVPKIYLETTMFSFYYEKRTTPFYIEQKALVRRIFELIQAGVYEPYTSLYAMDEIMKEPEAGKREQMKALITDNDISILPTSKEVLRLADLYIQEGAISPVYRTDAAHIAITVLNGLDFIVSLNFTHIARVWTIEKVRRVNAREKYQGIGIYKPSEVLEIYEDSSGLFE